MDHCPTCSAEYSGAAICHRCKTDFRQILAVERAASAWRQEALASLERGDGPEARDCAKRACALRRSPEALTALALVALRDGNNRLAFRLWQEIREVPGARIEATSLSGLGEPFPSPKPEEVARPAAPPLLDHSPPPSIARQLLGLGLETAADAALFAARLIRGGANRDRRH